MQQQSTPTHVLEKGKVGDNFFNREWILTNNTGAFSMGTAGGANTRRYHGLFVAATAPPVGRVVVLNQMLEKLIIGRQQIEFSTCLFQDEKGERVFAPQGYKLLNIFKRGATVSWVYEYSNITFTRALNLHWQEQAATINYKIAGLDNLKNMNQSVRLELAPMVTLRDFHSLCVSNQGEINWEEQEKSLALDTAFTARRDNLTCTFSSPKATISSKNQWWYNAQYPIDRRRGQGDKEDYFVPAAFVHEINLAQTSDTFETTVTVALGGKPVKPISDCQKKEKHLEPVIKAIKPYCNFIDSRKGAAVSTARCLALAGDDFIVRRRSNNKKLSTIIAGYPWFADWGRDTFIAMRGLLLTTGRFEEAKQILKAFSEYIKDGLVPNRFDDYNSDKAHYNTIDGSLLFIQAALDYYKKSGDKNTWSDWLSDACCLIVDNYIKGTCAGEKTKAQIKMGDDCLISGGNENTQLTWMDAALPDGKPFTPRQGKAVEINALWYSCLISLSEHLPEIKTDKKADYLKLAKKAKLSFGKLFWDDGKGFLADHVFTDETGENYDWSLRPNQIFALSVEHSPLSKVKQKKVLAVVRDNLLTYTGLRTLPQNDPNYHGVYVGDQRQRDEAYHQGTIWPWLIGPYVEAVLRVGKFAPAAKKQAKQAIAPLLLAVTKSKNNPLPNGAIGQLPEICEADNPDNAVGCPAQAWSVGELIRALELINNAPQ